jgi:hypothetical protein
VLAAQEEFAKAVDALEVDELADLRPAHYGPMLPVYRLRESRSSTFTMAPRSGCYVTYGVVMRG